MKRLIVRVAATLAALLPIAGCSRSPKDRGLAVPTYTRRQLPFVEGAEPFRVAIGDLNGDGRADFVVCGTTLERGFVRVYLAKDDGDYDFRDLDAPVAPRGIALADLDKHGHPDLITANNRAMSVSIFPSDGRGGFGPRQDIQLLRRPFAVLAEDVDRDGLPDLVAVGEGGVIAIAYNRGKFAFDNWRYIEQPYGPSNVIAVDLDGDGTKDFVVTNWRENNLAILWNRRRRRVYPGRAVPYDGKASFGVAGGDFDRDGHGDLAVALLDTAQIQLLFGLGDGSFRSGPKLPVGEGVRDVVSGRLRAGSEIDLVSTSTEAGEIRLFYGDGSGHFLTTDPLPAGTHPRSAAVGDLNGDGLDDIVVANLASHDVTVFLSRAGQLVAAVPVPPDPTEALRPLIALADVHAQAEKDFRAGNFPAALAGFERVVATGEPLFRAGTLVPTARSPEWKRYLASVALVSDIRRYHLNDPAGARDVERRLARLAESHRYFHVAAVEWMAVADIERYNLGDVPAAAAAYERIARLARSRAQAAPGAAVFPPIADGALYALDTLLPGEPAPERRLRSLVLPIPFAAYEPDVAGTIVPHASAYEAPPNVKPSPVFAAFAAAHPRSFRAAWADFFDYLAAQMLGPLAPGQLLPADNLHDAFLAKHPDDPLCFALVSHTLSVLKASHKEQAYAREAALARTLGANFGLDVQLADGETLAAAP